MPRVTDRKKFIKSLTNEVKRREYFCLLRCTLDDEDSLEDLVDLHYMMK